MLCNALWCGYLLACRGLRAFRGLPELQWLTLMFSMVWGMLVFRSMKPNQLSVVQTQPDEWRAELGPFVGHGTTHDEAVMILGECINDALHEATQCFKAWQEQSHEK